MISHPSGRSTIVDPHYRTECLLYSILEVSKSADEVAVDGRGSARSGSGGHDELLGAGGSRFASDVQAGDARAASGIGNEQPVSIDVGLKGIEVAECAAPCGPNETTATRNDRPVNEPDAGDAFAIALDLGDAAPLDGDAPRIELFLLEHGDDIDPVREYDQVVAPLREKKSPFAEIGEFADHRQGLIALVVPVALDTAVDARAIELTQRTNVGKGLVQARRHQNAACARGAGLASHLARDLEGIAIATDAYRHRHAVRSPLVGEELFTPQPPQLEGWNTVASEEPVRKQSGRVTGSVSVDQQGRAAGPNEIEGRAETRRPATDHDDVVDGLVARRHVCHR